MSFDPDGKTDEQQLSTEELLQILIAEVRRVARLLEVLTDTEVSVDDVED